MSMRTLLQKLGLKKDAAAGTDAAPTRLDKLTGALHLSLESIEKAGLTPDEQTLMVEETLGQFRSALLAKGKSDKVPKVKEEGVEEDEDEFAEDGEDEDEGEGEGGDNPFSGSDDEDDDGEDTPDEEDEDMPDEKVKKVEEMASEITALTKRLNDAEAAAAAAEARVTKFEQAEAERQIMAKAEKMVAGTAVPVEQAVMLLKTGGEEGEKALDAILKSTRQALADAQIFKELGAVGGVTVDGAVESIATEIRKREPSLTHEQAIAKAYRENPKLYDAAIQR